MQELTNADDDRVEVSVRMTSHLAAKAKSHPERQAAKYIERTFRRLDVRYRVVWDLPPVEGIPTTDAGKRAQLDAWSKKLNAAEPVPEVCKDSNILLTDRRGGGIAYSKLKGAIAPGAVYEDYEIAEWVTKKDPRHPFFGMLHEMGHNLAPHSGHDETWGRLWVEAAEEAWYRTPAAAAGKVNLCGEENDEPVDAYEKRDCLYFAECARDHLLIR